MALSTFDGSFHPLCPKVCMLLHPNPNGPQPTRPEVATDQGTRVGNHGYPYPLADAYCVTSLTMSSRIVPRTGSHE